MGTLVQTAFSRCQIKETEVVPQQLLVAANEANLMQADWGADNITFWTVELITQPLTQGVGTYTVPANAVTVLDVYVNNGSSSRILAGFSRTDYASLSNPSQQGFPTVFWQDRLLIQTLTLWPIPDGDATYTLYYYIYTQTQDAVPQQGGNVAIPYYWLEAWTAGLAYRLARHYAPQLEAVRKVDAEETYARASKQNEQVPIYISPNLQGYYRD